MTESTKVARLFVVRPGNSRLATAWGERGGSEWQDLGDRGECTFVIIGRETDDQECHKLAKRYGLDAGGLMAFRDCDRPGTFEVESRGPFQ